MTRPIPTQAPAEDSDLRWFFCDAAADVGFKSSNESLIEMATSGKSDGSGAARSPDGRMVRIVGDGETKDGRRFVLAAGKLRALSHAWEALTPEQRHVLRLAYGPVKQDTKRVHDQHRRRLGHWLSVVIDLQAVKALHVEACGKIQAAYDTRAGESTTVRRRAKEWIGAPKANKKRRLHKTSKEVLTCAKTKPIAARVPSVLEWLTNSSGPRIESERLRCSAHNDSGCTIVQGNAVVAVTWRCAVHESNKVVLEAWLAWDVLRREALTEAGLMKGRGPRTPRNFVYQREE